MKELQEHREKPGRPLFWQLPAALVCALVGCSLLTDFGGLNDPPTATSGSPDGSSGGNGDGGPNNVGDDGAIVTTNDGSPTQDALSTTSPCKAQHTFCDDFDRNTDVATGWTSTSITSGSLTIVSDTSVSPPSSLLLTLPAGDGGAFLIRDLGAASSTIHLEVDLDLAQTTPGPEVDLVQLRWLSPPSECTSLGYYIVRDRTGPLVLQETYGPAACGANKNDDLPFSPGPHHVVLDVTLGVVGHIRLKVDLGTIVDKDVRSLPASSMELRLGGGGLSVPSTWRIRYDNVSVDLK